MTGKEIAAKWVALRWDNPAGRVSLDYLADEIDKTLAETRAERDALQRHYDAAAPEHNLLSLLDLYAERETDARAHALACEATVKHLERTSKEVVAVVEAARAWANVPYDSSCKAGRRLVEALNALAAKEKETP